MIEIVKRKGFRKEKLVVRFSCMFFFDDFAKYGSEQYQIRGWIRRILESACSEYQKAGISASGFFL